jgi:hypothetical protein
VLDSAAALIAQIVLFLILRKKISEPVSQVTTL